MRDIRDMEREAARVAAMTPEEKAEHDRALAEWRRELGLSDDPANEQKAKRGDIRVQDGRTIRFVELDDRGEVWENLGAPVEQGEG